MQRADFKRVAGPAGHPRIPPRGSQGLPCLPPPPPLEFVTSRYTHTESRYTFKTPWCQTLFNRRILSVWWGRQDMPAAAEAFLAFLLPPGVSFPSSASSASASRRSDALPVPRASAAAPGSFFCVRFIFPFNHRCMCCRGRYPRTCTLTLVVTPWGSAAPLAPTHGAWWLFLNPEAFLD